MLNTQQESILGHVMKQLSIEKSQLEAEMGLSNRNKGPKSKKGVKIKIDEQKHIRCSSILSNGSVRSILSNSKQKR